MDPDYIPIAIILFVFGLILMRLVASHESGLVPCIHCRRPIGADAGQCLHCGGSTGYVRVAFWDWLAIIIVIVIVVGIFISDG